MIKLYKTQLKEYMKVKDIDKLIKDMKEEMRDGRKRWNDTYLLQSYIERRLYAIIQSYKNMPSELLEKLQAK